MRYWLFQNNQVIGPYSREELAAVAGFSAESLVCPEGRKGTQMGDWQRAGVVAELAETLLKAARVPAGAVAGADPGGSLLPPEPTLRDLAVLGTLQEKVTLLENSLSQLREDLRSRENEIASLKVELSQKAQETQSLQAKVGDLDAQVSTVTKNSSTPDAQTEQARMIADMRSQLDSLRSELMRLDSGQSQLRQDFESRPPAAASPKPSEAPAAGIDRFAPAPGPSLPPSLSPSPAPTPAPAPAPEPQLSSAPLGQPPPMDLPEISAQPPGPSVLSINPLGSPDAGPAPMLEIPAIAPEPAISPSPMGLEGLGGPSIPLGDAVPAVTLSPGPLPGIEIPAQNPALSKPSQFAPNLESPIPSMKTPLAAPPASVPDLEFVDLTEAAAKRRKGKGLFFKLFIVLLLGGAGAAYKMGLLAPLIANLAKRAKEGAQTPGEPAPAPEAKPPAGEAPAPSQDRTQEAIDFAKTYKIAGSGRTLDSALEGDNPPPGLSPWMVERLEGEKYHVNFYPAGSKKPAYEFEVRLDEHSLKGVTPDSSGLLDGSVTPPVGSSPDPGKKRRKRRRSEGDPLGAALMESSLGESGKSSGEDAAPAPKRKGRRKKAAAASGPLESADETILPPELGSDATGPAAKPAKGKEMSLDDLLLPGVPKRRP